MISHFTTPNTRCASHVVNYLIKNIYQRAHTTIVLKNSSKSSKITIANHHFYRKRLGSLIKNCMKNVLSTHVRTSDICICFHVSFAHICQTFVCNNIVLMVASNIFPHPNPLFKIGVASIRRRKRKLIHQRLRIIFATDAQRKCQQQIFCK